MASANSTNKNLTLHSFFTTPASCPSGCPSSVVCNRAAPPRRTKGPEANITRVRPTQGRDPGHSKPRPGNVGLSFTAPPLFVPSKVTVAIQKRASVLQEGEENTNIPSDRGRSGKTPTKTIQGRKW